MNKAIIEAIGAEYKDFSDFLHLEELQEALEVKASVNIDDKSLAKLDKIFAQIQDPLEFFNHLIHYRGIRGASQRAMYEYDPQDLQESNKTEKALKNKVLIQHNKYSFQTQENKFLHIEEKLCDLFGLKLNKAKLNHTLALTLTREYYNYLDRSRQKAGEKNETYKQLDFLMVNLLMGNFYLDANDKLYELSQEALTPNIQETFWFIYSKAIGANKGLKNEAEKQLIELVNHTRYTSEQDYKQSIFGYPESMKYWQCLYASLYCAREFYEASQNKINFSEENQELLINELIEQGHIGGAEPSDNETIGNIWTLVIENFNISDKILKKALKETKKAGAYQTPFAIAATHLEKHFLNKEVVALPSSIANANINKI